MVRLILSNTASEKKVLPPDIIPLLYDAGLDTAIRNRVGLGMIVGLTISELTNQLITVATNQGRDAIADVLDVDLVSAFVADMVQNGERIIFSQAIPTGARADEPTKPTLTDNGSLSLSIDATYPVGTKRVYIRFEEVNTAEVRVVVRTVTIVTVSPEARQITLNAIAGEWTVKVAVIDDAELIGFLSPASDPIILS